MKKEIIRTEDAVGKILAHDITRIVKGEFKGSLFKKGHIIAPEDVDRLLEERGEPQVRNGAKLADLLRRPRLTYADLAPFDPDRPDLAPAVASEAEITIKYEGYIQRQLRQVEEVKRLEARPLPADLDYQSIQGLRLEARQKLNDIRPQNLGQASRVSGVSPADVAVLMVYLKQNNSI